MGYAAVFEVTASSINGFAIRLDANDYIHFETEMEETLVYSSTISQDIRIYRNSKTSVMDFIVKHLHEDGWLKGTVGLEKWSYRPSPGYSERFQVALENHGISVVDATSILRVVRRLKSPQELEYIRSASRIADIGVLAARDALAAPGVTELDVYSELMHAMGKAGGEPAAIPLAVLTGARSATPQALTSRHKILPVSIYAGFTIDNTQMLREPPRLVLPRRVSKNTSLKPSTCFQHSIKSSNPIFELMR